MLAAAISDHDLERQIDPLMSPLVWDLAHIAAYEDLWLVHRRTGGPLLRADLAATYDAFETPRAVRGEVELLDADGARAYLATARERALAAAATRGVDPVIHELVLQHEQQHVETMLQTLTLAHLDGFDPQLRESPGPAAVPGAHSGLEFVPVAGGEIGLGAGPGRFSYDNERPRHVVTLAPFRIARTPVTNATWLVFAEGGGYERREWWSDEAWAWKEQWDITGPLHWARRPDRSWCELTACGPRDLDPDRPVCHVSWFEAAAFARAHDARLPTEAEWEAAATWTQPRKLTGPLDGPPQLGQRAFETTPVGCRCRPRPADHSAGEDPGRRNGCSGGWAAAAANAITRPPASRTLTASTSSAPADEHDEDRERRQLERGAERRQREQRGDACEPAHGQHAGLAPRRRHVERGDRRQQHRCPTGDCPPQTEALGVVVLGEAVADLEDDRDEDEVEEQLEPARVAVLVAAGAQLRRAPHRRRARGMGRMPRASRQQDRTSARESMRLRAPRSSPRPDPARRTSSRCRSGRRSSRGR